MLSRSLHSVSDTFSHHEFDSALPVQNTSCSLCTIDLIVTWEYSARGVELEVECEQPSCATAQAMHRTHALCSESAELWLLNGMHIEGEHCYDAAIYLYVSIVLSIHM